MSLYLTRVSQIMENTSHFGDSGCGEGLRGEEEVMRLGGV